MTHQDEFNKATIERFSAVHNAALCTRPLGLPLCIHALYDLRETLWTIGVGEQAICRIHAMGFSIRPWCDPAFMIKGRSDLVSNQSAETTDWQRRSLSPGSSRHLMNYRSG